MDQADLTYDEIRDIYVSHYYVQKDEYKYIRLTAEECKVVDKYATDASALRHGEDGYDDITLEKLREDFFSGAVAETACAIRLGHKQSELEFEVRGKASDFAHADLRALGYDCGVKVSRWGLPVLVVQKEKWKPGRCGAEMICTIYNKDIIRDENGRMVGVKGVWVNGVATDEQIRTYQDKTLVAKKNKRHEDRAGFYGFDKLWTMHTKEDIEVFKQIFKIDKNREK